MKRKFVVYASTRKAPDPKPDSKKRAIKASKSVDEMLMAFEDKLAEFGVESKTNVECAEDVLASEEVEIYEEDYEEKYEDVSGAGFGDPGKVYSLAEIKEIWNQNKDSDPVTTIFRSFDDWFNATRNNYLTEV